MGGKKIIERLMPKRLLEQVQLQGRNLSMRVRVMLALTAVAITCVAAIGLEGFLLRRSLLNRTRRSCEPLGAMFEEIVHERMRNVTSDAEALAQTLGRTLSAQQGPESLVLSPEPPGEVAKGFSSWAVYDADGSRVGGWRRADEAEALERVGVGTDRVSPGEAGRLARAMAREPQSALSPGSGPLYVLHYQPITGKGGAGLALQASAPAEDLVRAMPLQRGSLEARLLPSTAATEEAEPVTINTTGKLLFHYPFLYADRQVGRIVVAVPNDAEARYARVLALAIIGFSLLMGLLLIIVSRRLARTVVEPMEKVRHFIQSYQSGAEVEPLKNVSNNEAGSFLEVYLNLLNQAQDWADCLMESRRDIRALLCGSAEALVTAMEAKDIYTAGHSQRVAAVAGVMASELGWERSSVEEVRLAGLLHDIGKVGVQEAVLNKPGRLGEQEWNIIRQHPVKSSQIVQSIPGCEHVTKAVLNHHEHYDGSGYPHGQAGRNIPRMARIITVADVYDALTSARPYRPAFSYEEATRIMRTESGRILDPNLCEVFLTVFDHPVELVTGDTQLILGRGAELLKPVAARG